LVKEFMSNGLNLGDDMQVAYLIMLAVGALAGWYTAILYTRTQKNWWNPVAQVILVNSTSLSALFTWVFIARFWPSIPGRTVIGFILFSLVTLAMVWTAWTLTKLFRVVKRDKNARHPQEN